MKGLVVGGLVATAVFAAGPHQAHALTASEVQAQVSALMSQLAMLQEQLRALQQERIAQEGGASLTVTYPNGGEVLDNSGKKDAVATIRWSSSSASRRLRVNVDLLDADGRAVRRIAKNTSNDGKQAWPADADLPDGRYKVSVSSNDSGPSATDSSDGYFQLVGSPEDGASSDAPFSFAFPTESAALLTGKAYAVRWSGGRTGVESYAVYLGGGPLGNASVFLGYAGASQRSFSWTPSGSLQAGSGYRLSFRVAQDGSAEVSRPFSIVRPSGSVTPLSQITTGERFIKNLYKTFYDREPASTDSGLRFWLGSFRNGQPVGDLYRAFLRAGEFAERQGGISNRDYVRLMYRTVLYRDADDSGLGFWTAELDNARKDKEAALNAFLVSGEFVDTILPVLETLR